MAFAIGALVSGSGCTDGDAASPSGSVSASPSPTLPAAAAAPTWYRDVEPIVQRECAGCHSANGPGAFALDRATTVALAPLVVDQVATRQMPPWPPSRGGAALAGARILPEEDIAVLAAWAAAGAPEGDPHDHQERAPRAGALPARAADVHLTLGAGEGYTRPLSHFVTDEVRCFVLDLPASDAGLWVTAARWTSAAPIGIRTMGGVALDADDARAARLRERQDGRAGFECGGGVDALSRHPWIGSSGSATVGDGASILGSNDAVRIPAGGALLMRVHYAAVHLGDTEDHPGVDLWVASEADHRAVRPLFAASVAAPVEVPCPSGVSQDPANACSRERAFTRLALADAAAARAQSDARLVACGTTLASATAAVSSAPATVDANGTVAAPFLVSTSCASALPWDGVIRGVHARLQTWGASVRVEAEQDGGAWATVLDVPRWRWTWDSAYVLADGIAVAQGKHLRVSCTFDNGTGNQWSALTGEPGHDAPARPPVLSPAYLIAAPNRAAEACEASIDLERAPYRSAAWPTLCHEAQAVVDDACGPSAADLVSRGCPGEDEDASVALLGLSTAALRQARCPGHP